MVVVGGGDLVGGADELGREATLRRQVRATPRPRRMHDLTTGPGISAGRVEQSNGDVDRSRTELGRGDERQAAAER